MTEVLVDPERLRQCWAAYSENPLISQSVRVVVAHLMSCNLKLCDVEDPVSDVDTDPAFQRILNRRYSPWTQEMIIQRLLYGISAHTYDTETAKDGTVFVYPRAVNPAECDVYYSDVPGEPVRVYGTHRRYPDEEVFFRVYAPFDYATRSFQSQVGGLLPAHTDYYIITQSHMLAAARNAQIPLLIEPAPRAGDRLMGLHSAPVEGLYDHLAGRVNDAAREEMDAVHGYLLKLMNSTVQQLNTSDMSGKNVKDSRASGRVKDILKADLNKLPLPLNTRVASVSFPSIETSFDSAFSRMRELAMAGLGLESGTNVHEQVYHTMHNGGLTVNANFLAEYQRVTNDLLEDVFAEVCELSEITDMPYTLHLGTASLPLDTILQIVERNVLAPSFAIRELRTKFHMNVSDADIPVEPAVPRPKK